MFSWFEHSDSKVLNNWVKFNDFSLNIFSFFHLNIKYSGLRNKFSPKLNNSTQEDDILCIRQYESNALRCLKNHILLIDQKILSESVYAMIANLYHSYLTAWPSQSSSPL